MKLFSVRDTPPGDDSVSHIAPGSFHAEGLESFVQADVRYFGRGEQSEPAKHDDRETIVVVIQGLARLTVADVDHPVTAGDVAIVQRGEEFTLIADEVDPAVVLIVGARAAECR